MGKGRRLTISLSERFLGTHSSGKRHVESRSDEASDESELMEEDVWSVADHQTERDPVSVWASRAAAAAVAPSWGLKRSGRHVSGGVGGISADISSYGGGQRQIAASAPVSVPDWGKILRIESAESLHGDWYDDVEGIEFDGELVPPHEWVARGRRMGGASVLVGVGRTLKGRDMRRVRDTVWSQTGFDG